MKQNTPAACRLLLLSRRRREPPEFDAVRRQGAAALGALERLIVGPAALVPRDLDFLLIGLVFEWLVLGGVLGFCCKCVCALSRRLPTTRRAKSHTHTKKINPINQHKPKPAAKTNLGVALEREDVGGDAVEEVAVVRHGQDGAGKVGDRLLEAA
jgi:hypothetical protein